MNKTLAVVGQRSIDLLDMNTLEWSYSEDLRRLILQDSTATLIIAEDVVIVIHPLQLSSAWVYDIETKQFNDTCVLYNVAKRAWRAYNTTNIQHVTHTGEYSYVIGDEVYADNWNGTTATLNTPFTYAASAGPYITLFSISYFTVLQGRSTVSRPSFLWNDFEYGCIFSGSRMGQ